MIIGIGTLANMVTVAIGATIGLALGNRLPNRTKQLVIATLGLFTVVLGIFNAGSMASAEVSEALGSGVGTLIVLGSLLVGAVIGAGFRLQDRLDNLAARAAERSGGGSSHLVEAVITPTLVFCVGPLTILGAISDGMGRGAEQLLVKSVMDGFAAIAFAATFGAAVFWSVLTLGVIQGSITLVAYFLGGFLSQTQVLILEATGGVVLLGLGLRLLELRKLAVADLLPALLVAPVLVWLVGMALR